MAKGNGLPKPEPNHRFEGVTEVYRLGSNSGLTTCSICEAEISGGGFTLADEINHYLDEHSMKLLHIGTETTVDDRGLRHETVAFLGS